MTSLESKTHSEHQPSLSEITLDGLNNQDESESESEELFQDSLQEQHSNNKSTTIDIQDSKPSSSNQNGNQNSISISNADGDIDIDAPPAFPSLNSHQRSSASRLPINNNNNSNSHSPSTPNTSSNSSSLKSLLGIPSTSSSLLVPPSTTALTAPAGVGGASGTNLRIPTANSNTTSSSNALGPPGAPPKKERKKVALAPGCSPLDWAKIKKEQDLRGGITQLMRITPSMLKKHNKPEDAWSAFNGKVYNLTPYLRFHPGGEEELMRCAGRDGTRLFMLTHSWVNIDAMIDTAMVGMLVPEH